MSMDNRLLKLNDIAKIASSLIEMGYKDSGLSVSIPIRTQIMLNKINDEMFKKFGINENKVTDVSEVNLNIMGINFRYYLYKDEEND